jgi:arylformamidase
MTIHDISLTLDESLCAWPGHPPVSRRFLSEMAQGDIANVSLLSLSVHAGTHADGRCHFGMGPEGVDALDLSVLVGPALVVDARAASVLSAEAFERLTIPPDTERLIVRTRNSDLWASGAAQFAEDYVGVVASGARWLVNHNIRLIGVDYLSVAAYHDLIVPHQVLLGANVVIVEGLNLSEIAPGRYQFVCLPLKIAGGDGAPARAILIDD